MKTGLSDENNIDKNIEKLMDWQVLSDKPATLDENLKYELITETLGRFLNIESDYLNYFIDCKWIDDNTKSDEKVNKQEAHELIEKTLDIINDADFDSIYRYEYNREIKDEDDNLEVGDLIIEDDTYKIITSIDNGEYVKEDAAFEDVYSYYEIADSFEIDFDKAEVIPYYQDDALYVNENYNLLSSKSHVFNTDGFRVSYSIKSSGIDIHVSKNVDDMNIYLDLDINSVKPKFKWLYEENDLKNCFFSVKFNATEKFGVSDGKYGNYYLDFKNLDSSSFMSLLKSTVNPMKDYVEASIPICKIKTPIPNIPAANICLDILIKLYASGKIEVVMYNSHLLGFETKDGNIRFINERENDFDSIINASGKAAMGINLALETAGMRLADIELDAGIKAEVKSTIHLYDESGDNSSQYSDVSYSALQAISKENENVKICGDLSLYWMMDLQLNTSKTKMAKMGFSRSYHILDDDNQIFGNLHHLENGHFVEKCTRKNKANIKSMETVKSDKITLDSYAEVIKDNETYQIIVKSLPEGYKQSDLIYSSQDNGIATVSNGLIKAVKPGSVKIEVKTADGKYISYVNILVSTG